MRSYMGVTLSLIYGTLLFMFFLVKITTIQTKADVDIMSTVLRRGLPNDFKFSANEGFYFAATLTDYSDEREPEDYSKYGTLRFQ